MPASHVVYLVTAVVVLGLVAWVVAILARPDRQEPAKPALPKEGGERPAADAKPDEVPTIQDVTEGMPPRQRLQSHQEIQDEAPDAGRKRSNGSEVKGT